MIVVATANSLADVWQYRRTNCLDWFLFHYHHRQHLVIGFSVRKAEFHRNHGYVVFFFP